MIDQYDIRLPSYPRGIHIITDHVMGSIPTLPDKGLMNIFIKHTSAALTINENADPAVRSDFERIMNKLVPENEPFYTHTAEGPDDMPSHVKSSMMGFSVNIPISGGRLDMGTWQGIYLCEFRNKGGGRKLLVTIYS